MKKMIVLLLTLTLTMHLATTVFAAIMPTVLNAVNTYKEQIIGLNAKLWGSEMQYLNPLRYLTLSPVFHFLLILKTQQGFRARASPQ